MEVTALDKYTRAISSASLSRNLSMTTAIGISSSLVTLHLITGGSAPKLAISVVIISTFYMYLYLLAAPSISLRYGLQTIKSKTLVIWNNLGIKHHSLCGKLFIAYAFLEWQQLSY